MPINVTIFHDTDGNILSTVKDPAPPTPAGFTALAKTIDAFSDVHNKKVRTGDNELVNRDYLELVTTSGNSLGVGNVGIITFKKVNGDTGLDMTASTDDEDISADLRSDLNEITDLGFLRDESGSLVSGAISFELAAPSVPSSENLVLYNSTLQLLRLNMTYG